MFTAIFPELFIGIRRTLTANKTNDELEFTTTPGSQIQIRDLRIENIGEGYHKSNIHHSNECTK